ncbi:MAG: hypothetical protein NVS3B26_22010 [Mycobacteriales bacterium]
MSTMRDLDDRVLGRLRRGDGPAAVLRVVWRVSRYVLLSLAVIVLLGVLFTKAPTNAHNVIVRNVLSLAREVAGPFRDVFAPKRPQDALVINYLVAAGVYLLIGVVVGKLPPRGQR